MLERLASLLTILVLLFGMLLLPAISHAQAPSHGEASFEVHEHDLSTDHDDTGDEGEQPCHAVTHHHCSFAIGVDANHIKGHSVYQGSKSRIISSAAMKSWSQAPPTQPPSA